MNIVRLLTCAFILATFYSSSYALLAVPVKQLRLRDKVVCAAGNVVVMHKWIPGFDYKYQMYVFDKQHGRLINITTQSGIASAFHVKLNRAFSQMFTLDRTHCERRYARFMGDDVQSFMHYTTAYETATGAKVGELREQPQETVLTRMNNAQPVECLTEHYELSRDDFKVFPKSNFVIEKSTNELCFLIRDTEVPSTPEVER